jgi:hypothetical protein
VIVTHELSVDVAEVESTLDRSTEEAKQALAQAVLPVQAQVRDFTPRWRGLLVEKVLIRSENDGMTQVVYLQGVVGRVHEMNAVWSAMPPAEPIQMWVEEKLGVPEEEARGVAFAIAKKIKDQGLTLPNREGRGQMFQRTATLFEKTKAHFAAFRAALSFMLRGA